MRFAALLLTLPLLAACGAFDLSDTHSGWTYDHGGVIRGDRTEPVIALIFTGGSYGEGADHILDILDRQGAKASFFVTGDFTSQEIHRDVLRRMVREGHYLARTRRRICSTRRGRIEKSRSSARKSFARTSISTSPTCGVSVPCGATA